VEKSLNLVEKIKKHSWTILPESSFKILNKLPKKKKNLQVFCLSIQSRKRKEKSILKPKQFHGKIKKFVLSRKSHCVTFSGFEEATEARLERNKCSDLDLILIRFFVIFFNEILCVASFKAIEVFGMSEMIECSL
jgi:hypothetical protein